MRQGWMLEYQHVFSSTNLQVVVAIEALRAPFAPAELERLSLDREPSQVIELRQQVERDPRAECRGSVEHGPSAAHASASPAMSARGTP